MLKTIGEVFPLERTGWRPRIYYVRGVEL
jgi:hypothetical protein